MKQGLDTATELLIKYRSVLDTIAQRLIKDETLDRSSSMK